MPQQPEKPSEKNAVSGFIFRLMSLFISTAVIVYLGYHFINSFSSEIETEYALLITENDVISLDGYVLRNEILIASSVSGNVGYLYPDGTKVRSGTDIVSIYSGNNSAENTISSIDKQLDLLKASSISDSTASADTATLDVRISDVYYAIRRATENGSFANLSKRRDSLLTLINKRRLVVGMETTYDDVIETLENTRTRLTEELGTAKETVISPCSGYFYSSPDGYEAIFTPDVVQTLSFEKFDEMLAAEPAIAADLIVLAEDSDADTPTDGNDTVEEETSFVTVNAVDKSQLTVVGKIATDFEWYIVSECTRESLRYFQKGNYYQVNFPYNNDTAIRMELTNIVSEVGNDRVLAVFRSNLIPEDFSFRRMQPIEVIRSSFTGYKVPISAVRLLNGIEGVYVLVGNQVTFRTIDILLEMEGYYIVVPYNSEAEPTEIIIADTVFTVEALDLYDRIITGGKNLYIGKMIS